MNDNYIRIAQMSEHVGEEVLLKGWIYNSRAGGKVQFLMVRDGSGMCQAVMEKTDGNAELFSEVKHLGQESSLEVSGTVRVDERSAGGHELAVSEVRIVHKTQDYPITPKVHGPDFLMKHRHLHLRSQKQWALARIRHTVIEAIRDFFNDNGFTLVDTPIFAPAAGEGEQTLFNVDYFGEEVALAQTGQLYLEAAALALGKVYCFGPTFRAEKSKTRRHLTEFWMVEPEIAYIDLDGLMEVAEQFVYSIVKAVLEKRRVELKVMERDVSELEKIELPFYRVSYTEAVDILHSERVKEFLENQLQQKKQQVSELESNIAQWTEEKETAKKQWQQEKLTQQIMIAREEVSELQEQINNIPHHLELAASFNWGKDLGGSDETIISQLHDRPVFVHRYPKAAKAFYMKPDPENEKVVLNIDMLAPQGYGEIIGGSIREENYESLLGRIKELDYDQAEYEWYLDLRRYGSVPHGGFGLGVERTVAWIAGIKHIRETIAFPRMMGKIYP
jgi:asparaginyl-tRNA synthetase